MADLTDERLAEIRARDGWLIFPHVTTAAIDRRDLLAEVARLRDREDRIRAACAYAPQLAGAVIAVLDEDQAEQDPYGRSADA